MGADQSTASPAGQSRPISGDTLGGYRREEIPLEQAKSNISGGQTPVSAMKQSGRGSSLLPAIGAEAEKTTSTGRGQSYGADNDIVHGGEQYSDTANRLDPHVHGALVEPDTYQAGSDIEAGKVLPRSASHT